MFNWEVSDTIISLMLIIMNLNYYYIKYFIKVYTKYILKALTNNLFVLKVI